MIRVVRSELTRLGSPSLLLGGIGLMTFFGLLATVVVFVTAGSGSATLPGTQNITVAMLEAPDGMFAGLQTFAGMLGIVALVVWALSATTDVSSGLIRLLVQAEPRRLLLLGGKIVALVVFTCAATLVATVIVLPMVLVVALAAHHAAQHHARQQPAHAAALPVAALLHGHGALGRGVQSQLPAGRGG